MANNDLRSAGAVWGGFLARYLLNLDIRRHPLFPPVMLPRSVIRSAAKVLVYDRGEQGGRRADAGTGRRKYLKDKNSLWNESNTSAKNSTAIGSGLFS